MYKEQRIILASQSPRRKQLLEWAEVQFEVHVIPTDESYPNHLTPEEVAMHIAIEKAKVVQKSINEAKAIILAADTIVVLENTIIGKPKNTQEAYAILEQLSGKKHRVITGVALLKGEVTKLFYDTTYVSFYALSQEQIKFYVDKYQPMDKAGAYAIQEWIGVVGIEKIEGDFYNVMGLPVSKVLKVFSEL